jgi:hypothetical protein
VSSNRLGVWEGVGQIRVIDLLIKSSSCIRASEPMERDVVRRFDRSTSSMESRNKWLVPRTKSTLGRGLRRRGWKICREGESDCKRIDLLRGSQDS